MSYSCSISFKSMEAKDVFPFLKEFKLFINEHLKEIAKENFGYCPIFRKNPFEIPQLQDVSKEEFEEAKQWVVNGVFKYRYFYDEERKLLGIYGVPSCVDELFDGSVYFQNSTDQDYTRDEYKGIKEFEEIFDHWYSMNEETFFKSYYEKYGESCSRDYLEDAEKGSEEYQENFEYLKRSMIYNEIWRPIADTLFDDESALYLSLYGGYDVEKKYAFIRYCYDERVKWEEQFKEKDSNSSKISDIGDDVLEDR